MGLRRLAAAGLLIALVVGVVLPGCSSKGSADKKTLTIALGEEIESTDVQQVNWSNVVHDLIYTPLITMGPQNNQVMPAACSSVTIAPDNLSITLKFPPEMKFGDGTPITADMIKASIERYISISPYGSDWDPVEGIDVADAHTLVLKLKEPAAFFLYAICTAYAGIVDAAKAASMGKEAFGRAAVTYGPYMVKEWQQGSQVTLVKNPYYINSEPFVKNKGPAGFDTVVVRFIPDSFTRTQELLRGNIDMMMDVPIESVPQLQGSKNVVVEKYLEPGTHYIAFNTKSGPFSDLKLRQAVAYAVNRDEIQTALSGGVKPQYGIMAPAQICFDQAAEDAVKAQLAFNLDKAKQLLAEAGYADTNGDGFVEKDGRPFSPTIMVSNDRGMDRLAAPVVQQQLKAIGINAQVAEYEHSYVRQNIADNKFDMAIYNHVWTDPDIWYYTFHSSQTKNWSSPETDRILEQGRVTMDMAARTATYAKLTQAIADQLPVLPLFSQYNYIAYRSNVRGLVIGVDGTLYWSDVAKK